MTTEYQIDGPQRLLHRRDGEWRTAGWLAEPIVWRPRYEWMPWRSDGQGEGVAPAAWVFAGASLEWTVSLGRWDAAEIAALRTLGGFRDDGSAPPELIGTLFVPGTHTWDVAVEGDRIRRVLAGALLVGPGDPLASRQAGRLSLSWRSPMNPSTGSYWIEENVGA